MFLLNSLGSEHSYLQIQLQLALSCTTLVRDWWSLVVMLAWAFYRGLIQCDQRCHAVCQSTQAPLRFCSICQPSVILPLSSHPLFPPIHWRVCQGQNHTGSFTENSIVIALSEKKKKSPQLTCLVNRRRVIPSPFSTHGLSCLSSLPSLTASYPSKSRPFQALPS